MHYSVHAQARTTDRNQFENVATKAIAHYARRWKPKTLLVNRSYLRNQIHPWFGGRDIREIAKGDVQRWFAALRSTPSAANRSLPVLSLIFKHAEAIGYRPADSNPCSGIRRYREAGRTRFLTKPELHRLGRALREYESVAPMACAVARLLVLTGCRQSEVRTLRWSDYREGNLFLRDSKSGPRMVWLAPQAESILHALPRSSAWVFPGSGGIRPMSASVLYSRWVELRDAAGLPGVRLHDLRHTYASVALQQGEPIVTIGRLLGHQDPKSTLRYMHFADDMARSAVELVSSRMGG